LLKSPRSISRPVSEENPERLKACLVPVLRDRHRSARLPARLRRRASVNRNKVGSLERFRPVERLKAVNR
jgi:hypothetical protein